MDGSLLEPPAGGYLERGEGALLLKNPDGFILGGKWGMEPSPETRAIYARILTDGWRA